MTTEQQKILVPIDAHGVDRTTLETLVAIASKLGRGLLGVVLENPRLQQAAELPFTTEIVLAGGEERNLQREQLSQRGAKTIRAARHLLGELADRYRVTISFETASGERLHTAMTRDGQLDIFLPRRQRWHAVAVSYTPSSRVRTKRLGLVLSGGAEDAAVMAAAGAMLALGQAAQVYLYSQQQLTPELLGTLARPGVRLCVQARFKPDPDNLVALIAQSPYELLILPRHIVSDIEPAILDKALDAGAGQVLIVN